MKDLGIDFGLLIAYVAPGMLLIWGISPCTTDLSGVLISAQSETADAVAWLQLLLISLVAGMIISVIRAGTIDRTFAINLPFIHSRAAHYAAVHRVEPDYSRLASEHVLAAYLEAKASEKRPYQFYGNLLIALIFASARTSSTDFKLTAVLLFSCIFLYFSARRSHARFITAVVQLNNK
jgi:hypothetical protein